LLLLLTAVAERWQISVEAGFRLTDGEGLEIRIGQRKCEELLYAMALRQEKLISRDSLAQEIWPLDSMGARRDNFRQALRKLRTAVGGGRILADRHSVGFAPGFRIEVSLAKDPKQSATTDLRKRSATDGLLNLLDWQATDQPALMFETLRVNVALARALPPKVISRLVRSAAPHLSTTDSNRHWTSFWIGSTHFATSGLAKAGPFLERALNSGLGIADGQLVLESGLPLAVGLILAGKPKEAAGLLYRISAQTFIPQSEKRRLEVIRAAAYQHLGRHEESNRLLQRQPNTSTSLESADEQALSAFFHSTVGRFRSASDEVSEPYQMARRIGARGIIHACELAFGYIDASEAPLTGIEKLDRIAEQCEEGGFTHLALYAKEGAAIGCANANQISEAKVRLEGVLSIRRSLGFGLTQWDRQRLAPVVTLAGRTSPFFG
jgi:hypothetical protein